MENTGIRYPGSIRIAAAVSLAALFIVIAIKMVPDQQPLALKPKPIQLSARQYIDESDTDGDGLPDWQETLIGTDPHDPDSDKNGIVDSVADKKSAFSLSDATSTDLLPADALGYRLLDEYTRLKENGAYTPTQATLLGKKLAQEIKPTVIITPHTINDLVLLDDSSTEAVASHREQLKEVVAPFFNLTEPEFVIYGTFIETGDVDELQKLAEYATVYRDVARNMLETPVPKKMASIQIEIVNSLNLFASVLEAMVVHANDPFASLTLLTTYNQSEGFVKAAFAALADEYRTRLFSTL